jgi:ATP-dependent Lon protease
MVVPLFVGRDKSISALEEVMDKGQELLFLAQKDADTNDPKKEDLYEVGTIGKVLQLLKLPDGTVKVLVEGIKRAKVEELIPHENFLEAKIEVISEEKIEDKTIIAISRQVVSRFEDFVKLNTKVASEVVSSLKDINDPSKIADTIASQMTGNVSEKQKLLEIFNLEERLNDILNLLDGELSVLQVEKKIKRRVKNQMEKTQKEYYLNEQMKAIQKELDDDEEGIDDIAEIEEKIKNTKLSKEALEKTKNELKKLKQMSPMSAEATVVRNYLDWILDIPWGKKEKS